MKRPVIENYPLLSTMVVSALALTAVTILILVICFQAYRHQRQLKSQSPSMRYKNLLKDEQNVEALVQFLQQQRENL